VTSRQGIEKNPRRKEARAQGESTKEGKKEDVEIGGEREGNQKTMTFLV
jgi:hypothetical protein